MPVLTTHPHLPLALLSPGRDPIHSTSSSLMKTSAPFLLGRMGFKPSLSSTRNINNAGDAFRPLFPPVAATVYAPVPDSLKPPHESFSKKTHRAVELSYLDIVLHFSR